MMLRLAGPLALNMTLLYLNGIDSKKQNLHAFVMIDTVFWVFFFSLSVPLEGEMSLTWFNDCSKYKLLTTFCRIVIFLV